MEREATRQPYTPAAPDQKTAAVMAKLEAQVAALTTDDSFRRYLDLQSRFRTFSYRNTLLIMAQDPDATLLKGYRQWQEMGRQVRKGSKAIDIFAPIWPKGTAKEQQKEVEPSGFIPVKVFDIRHTDGPPLPAPPHVPELVGEQGKREYQAMTLASVLDFDFTVLETEDGEMPDSRMGDWQPAERRIRIAREYLGHPRSQLQKVSTLAHETAHGLNDHGGPKDFTTDAERETIAQGSSYLALAVLGLDNGERTFPYIAGFAKEVAVLKRVLGTIQRTGKKIAEHTMQHLEDIPVEPAPRPIELFSRNSVAQTVPALGAHVASESPLDSHRVVQRSTRTDSSAGRLGRIYAYHHDYDFLPMDNAPVLASTATRMGPPRPR